MSWSTRSAREGRRETRHHDDSMSTAATTAAVPMISMAMKRTPVALICTVKNSSHGISTVRIDVKSSDKTLTMSYYYSYYYYYYDYYYYYYYCYYYFCS